MVPAVVGMIARHLTNLRRCITNLLLSPIPLKDIQSMLLLQFFSTFPRKSIPCSLSSYTTLLGDYCANPNCQRTRSRWCLSTMQKHTSGTLAVHVSLPATQNSGRWLNFASYGCHTIYNRNKKQLS